jgi:hypothetical protein
VFNLTYTGASPPTTPLAGIPSSLKERLQDWAEEGPYALGLSLEHTYSETSLEADECNWKGKDKDMIELVTSLAAAREVVAFVGRSEVRMDGYDSHYFVSGMRWNFVGKWLGPKRADQMQLVRTGMQVEEQMKISRHGESVTGNEGKLGQLGQS